MAYSLVSSPLDYHRLYVLTQPAVPKAKGVLGLYTSADQGQTWQLAITTASLTSGNIFFVQPGNDTSEEIYIYLPDLGASGLKVSKDAGRNFTHTGTLPFGSIAGLLAIPGAPGQLLAYGNGGMARSTNSGATWQIIKGITSGAVKG